MNELAGFAPEDALRLKVFLPDLFRRGQRALECGQKFVHYTAAVSAVSMIRNRQIWLRNAQCMNDFSEVQHGLELLKHAYRSPQGQRLLDFFEQLYGGFRRESKERFDAISERIRLDTYITCLSEHDASEDRIGRLSMWRAHSGTCGIAFVLNKGPLLGSGADAVNTGPVLYAGRKLFLERFREFVDGVIGHEDYVASLGAEQAQRNLTGSYFFGALSTKHPGFAEEREWRIVHNPGMQPQGCLVRSVEMCRNEPQVVYKLPLRGPTDAGIAGLDLRECLEALIIGPCENPRAVRDAFVELLAEADVENAADIIRISDIPIR